MKKSFLERSPYDRPAFTLSGYIEPARIARLRAKKRRLEDQIRGIDARIKAILTPPKRK